MTETTPAQRASLYRQHNKTKRCACDRCKAFRAESPRLAATEDGIIETANRSKQYIAGDYS